MRVLSWTVDHRTVPLFEMDSQNYGLFTVDACHILNITDAHLRQLARRFGYSPRHVRDHPQEAVLLELVRHFGIKRVYGDILLWPLHDVLRAAFRLDNDACLRIQNWVVDDLLTHNFRFHAELNEHSDIASQLPWQSTSAGQRTSMINGGKKPKANAT